MKSLNAMGAALLAATAFIAVSPASAYDGYGSGRDRAERQNHRIERGVTSGRLTRYEALELRREQARIAELQRRARRDGYVDPVERRRIEHARDRASRNIWLEKHDRDGRFRRYGYWGGGRSQH